MVAAVVAIGGTLVSAYGANEQRKDANKAQKQGDQLGQDQLNLGRDTLDWNKDRYNEWSSSFMPVLDDIKNQAYKSLNPDYGTVASDINSAFDTSQGVQARNMERMGVKPTDGAMAQQQIDYGLGRATAEVAGRQQERNRVRTQSLQNLEGVFQLGNPMLTGSMQGVNGSSNTLSGAYGNQQGNQYGMSNIYGQGAGALTNQAIGYGMRAINGMTGGGGSYSNGSGSYSGSGTNTYNGPVMNGPPSP